MKKILTTFSLLFLLYGLGLAAGRQPVFTSWYGIPYHGQLTASGEPFDMYSPTVAHRKLSFGTILEITNDAISRSIIARVTDRGPFIPGRDLDISYGCAFLLGTIKPGVALLSIREIEQEEVSWAILKMNEEVKELSRLALEDRIRRRLITGTEYLLMIQAIRSLVTMPGSKKGKAGSGY